MPHERIDLRSDTVTHPTQEMRRAMAEAELGDDVFGDDPTVIALEERAAELTGKQAALFVPSGTMGNLVCQMAHVPRGGEIILDRDAHIVQHEAAGHAVVVGASTSTVPAREDGTMDPEAIRGAFRDASDPHNPTTALVAIENTHSQSMGQPLPAAYTDEVGAVAHERGVPLHVDGARLFNAVVALGTPASRLLEAADSASFCLSKGLACPVGSLVVGSRDFIWRARRARKLLGGGMRQAGVLAAAGLVALRDGPSGMIDRLAEDHATARRLAEGLAELPGVGGIDPARVRTNFILFRLRPRTASPASRLPIRRVHSLFLDALAAEGVLMVDYPNDLIRAVTHYGIGEEQVDTALLRVRRALETVGVVASAVPVGAA